MSLYQPSYMTPRNSTIDTTVEEQLNFSCKLNGNSLLYGYDIIIYDAESNDIVFQLTSPESKTLLQKELASVQTEIAALATQKANREQLMKDFASDSADDNFLSTLRKNRELCLEKLQGMINNLDLAGSFKVESTSDITSGFMLASTSSKDLTTNLDTFENGSSSDTTFFKLADEIIELVNENSLLAKDLQTRIEGKYYTVIKKFQDRINNNSIQLEVNIDKYNKYKSTNSKNEKTISQLRRIINYSTDTVSSSDTSTRTIYSEYWKKIAESLEDQIDETEELLKKRRKRAENLEIAISSLNKGMYMLSEPLYPSDQYGNPTELIHVMPKNVVFNGGNYKWKIRLYWSSTGERDNLDKSIDSYESYFECRTMPIISISNLSGDSNRMPRIDKRYYEFIGSYTQREHVPVTYFRWILTQESTGEVLKDTGYIPSPDIRFYYDGFMNDYKYTIQLFVINQNDVEVFTEPQVFKVNYVGVFVDNIVKAQSAPEEHGIVVSWSGIHGVTGTVYGDYTYCKDLPTTLHTSLELPKGSSLVFDKDNDDTMRIPATTTTHIISIRIDDPDIETIYEASGSNGGLPYYRRLTLEGETLVYNINGVKEFRWDIHPDKRHWYVIFMLPDKLLVSEKWADGLFPSDLYNENLIGEGIFEEDENGLTPHVGLYPKALRYYNREEEVLI